MTAPAHAVVDHADRYGDDDDGDPVPDTATPGRQDGWTPTRQRNFLTFLAEGHTVELACRCVGLTVSSAYALRRRAGGAAFALGWQAATLLARDTVADALATRAIDGQVETITRADGSTVTQHRFDNRLALSMLLRLDRQADAEAGGGIVPCGADGRVRLGGVSRGARARSGAGACGLVPGAAQRGCGSGAGPRSRPDRRTGTGGSLRADGRAVLAELDAGDLDPARRADWGAADWARAEAVGLVALAPPPVATTPTGAAEGPIAGAAAGDEDETPGAPPLPPLRPGPPLRSDRTGPVWWDADADDWRTWFPPPADFDDLQEGTPDSDYYERALTIDELTILEDARDALVVEPADPAALERDAWFAGLLARTLAAGTAAAAAGTEEAAPG